MDQGHSIDFLYALDAFNRLDERCRQA